MKQSQLRSLFLTSALALAVSVSACGNPSNTSAPVPNTGNIPQLAARPTPQSSALKKLRFSGRVFDSVTGEPLEQAQVWIQVAETSGPEVPVAPMGPASGPAPVNPSQSPAGPSPVTVTPAPAGMSPLPPAKPPASVSPSPGPVLPPPSGIPLPVGALPNHQGWLWGIGAQAARSPQTAAKASKKTAEQESGLFRTTTNNQGKFWINDVPEGQHIITIQAPKYRILTLTQVSAGQLEIPLTPLNSSRTTSMAGMVLSPADTPVARAQVSPSYFWGDPAGLPAQTTALGEFLLQDVPFGKHVLAAFVMDEEFVIQQLGFSDEVLITDKSVKAKKPALSAAEPEDKKLPSEPRTDPEKRKELEDKVENILKETPAPAAEPSPTQPVASPSAPASSAPNTPPAGPVENEEVEKQDKPFNLFSAVSELVTGKKAEEADAVKDGSVYPVITLRSVLSDFKIEGEVSIPPGFSYRGMDVYLTLKAGKEERPQEVLLFTLPPQKQKRMENASPAKTEDKVEPQDHKEPKVAKVPQPKETPKLSKAVAPAATKEEPEVQPFTLRLPSLEKGQSYHFQFTAASHESGRLLYHHLYEIGEKNEQPLLAEFLSAPAGLEISGEEDNAIPTSPEIAWEAVPGAEYYRVLLEAGNPPNNQVIWEAWTKDTRIVYPLSTSAGRLKEGELYTVSVAAVKGLQPALKSSKQTFTHPGYQTIWTELSTLTRPPFEVVDSES